MLTMSIDSDAYYASAARHYFASGAALGSRGSKKQEEGWLSLFRWDYVWLR